MKERTIISVPGFKLVEIVINGVVMEYEIKMEVYSFGFCTWSVICTSKDINKARKVFDKISSNGKKNKNNKKR